MSSTSSPPKRQHRWGHKRTPRASQPYHKQQINDSPAHNELLHRLSLPLASPSGTLLERIGGSAALTDSDQGEDSDAAPHYYTPEPAEVERFLESVIGAPPGPVHTCSAALALETNVDRPARVADPSSAASYSPTQTAVNSANTPVHLSPLLDETMAPPSAPAIEECKKHLVPVLLASAQARGPGQRLDSERCLGLLSDDQCRHFFRQAKEMRLQLASQRCGSLKRDSVGGMDKRSRFSPTNTVASRKDSDARVESPPSGRWPPKAPRAMLQASQAARSKRPEDEAPCLHPTTEDRPQGSGERVGHEPATEMETSNASAEQPTGARSRHPSQTASSTHASASSSATDFVSHLPTQPGIWFKQLGRRHAEIVDVEIDVSDELFYMSGERRPLGLRMHLRLGSVPVGTMAKRDGGDTLASLQDVDGAIERHALRWPKKGTLILQVNTESERSKTWLPCALESDPLEVTSCMRPGKNTFRFIQLSDLSEFTFVLVASPPPPEEEWRGWDWPSLVERSRTESSSADSPVNGLSEFAHLPVVIRS